jgi:hypothetical protein
MGLDRLPMPHQERLQRLLGHRWLGIIPADFQPTLAGPHVMVAATDWRKLFAVAADPENMGPAPGDESPYRTSFPRVLFFC